MRRHSRLALIAAVAGLAAVIGGLVAALTASSTGSSGADWALRVNTSAGNMVVTGSGMTVYVYLPDTNNPPTSTCTGDCADDWPPVTLATTTPLVDGIPRSRIGGLTRGDGTRQLTLNGYPVYRFAGDRHPGETRGESVGNAWFAVAPDGNFLPLSPAAFTPRGRSSDQTVTVVSTPIGPIVADSNGQTLYAYKDDTPTTSACTAAWCTQDWPPLLVRRPPTAAKGITASLGVLRRPDGSLQVSLAGYPLYTFSGDQHPGDLRGQGVGRDWYSIAPDGNKVNART